MIDLKKYLLEQMRMSHIYQPVMIRTLLQSKGVADKSKIAKNFAQYDLSQQEYYEMIVHTMPGRVLAKNNVVIKNKNEYQLIGFGNLSQSEINELIAICNDRLETFIKKRGAAIWSHRTKNRKAISGSVRYEVLKRARGRCELCGISKEEKALEVDHIVPKNWNGKDSLANYQALCYTCNSNKRDTDSTDFRNLSADYKSRLASCVFCKPDDAEIVLENNLAFILKDKFPVTQGHALIIPKRHCIDYFDLAQPEMNAFTELSHEYKRMVKTKYPEIEGFNLGYNAGRVAGQTIDHCHMHIIPRRKDDVQVPIGGIRNIIPGKGVY